MSDLEERVERIEEELDLDPDDDSLDWSWDHEMIGRDLNCSGYDVGVDRDGDLIIQHGDHTKCINSRYLDEAARISQEARE